MLCPLVRSCTVVSMSHGRHMEKRYLFATRSVRIATHFQLRAIHVSGRAGAASSGFLPDSAWRKSSAASVNSARLSCRVTASTGARSRMSRHACCQACFILRCLGSAVIYRQASAIVCSHPNSGDPLARDAY
jgi:hypothetical protein